MTTYQPPELEKTIRELNDAQIAVRDRLDDVNGLDFFGAGEVGDGAAQLEGRL